MSAFSKSLIAASGLVFAGALGASAATMDFTTAGLSASGTLGGVGYELTASGGSLVLGAPDAPNLAGPLAFDTDGVGIGDDEVSNTQTLTVKFDSTQTITGLHFLDLFDPEGATATFFSGGEVVETLGSVSPTNQFGYEVNTFAGIVADSIVFTTSGSADDGTIDFALAAIDIDSDGNTAPIPLPAGGLLLIAALGGLAATRRKA